MDAITVFFCNEVASSIISMLTKHVIINERSCSCKHIVRNSDIYEVYWSLMEKDKYPISHPRK